MPVKDDPHRLRASLPVSEFHGLHVDLNNMGDTYHRPDQKTLQALKDMANKLRIDSIESTNTAGSGYVQYAVILMLNFAAWFNSQVAFKLPDFIFQTSVFVLFYG